MVEVEEGMEGITGEALAILVVEKLCDILNVVVIMTGAEYQASDMGLLVENATIVGAATETELEDRELPIDDAETMTFAAIEDGIVPGGGATWVHLSTAITAIKETVSTGIMTLVPRMLVILKDIMHVPSAMRDFEDKDRKAFLSNSGRDMKNILTKVKESEKKVQVNVPLISALVCLMREVQSLSYSRKDLSKSYVWELKNSV
ncbi:hypothetical protein ARALYDRAFT_335160 [Arabidopsis lyrata subsp. lyrata]|uniref:Uncharacterized protein n=1 Tax=Arabidopsis lyrata subsp. lyrata TaxID=81972 RepID=D7KH98_ARALL|nr:hypothetical protein ARALYDRAFT_335160 [Arabidopsis lyrata subsp. lyrata]